MLRLFQKKTKLRYLIAICFIIALVLAYIKFDINQFYALFESNQSSYNQFSTLTALTLFFLRSLSIIIPMLPGTYCSVIAGYIFGIEVGIILIFLADLFSCSCSFSLSRYFGREFIGNLLGTKQMRRVEKIGSKYIEKNFFLMTGFLMTQFFDFVCYAIGLTKVSWRKFMPALIISILISDMPFVAVGYSYRSFQGVSLKELLNGDVSFLDGKYLIIFIISILLIFLLGLINMRLQNKSHRSDF